VIKHYDNKTEKVGDGIKEDIKNGSKINVASAIFSMYGFESLKKELSKVEEFRFIFTDPAFVELSKEKKEQKQFEVISNKIKKAISGSDFELNLKNELKGKVIAKECRKWIEEKARFKSKKSNKFIQSHLSIKNEEENVVYYGINEFSSAGFGYEKDNTVFNPITRIEGNEETKEYFNGFNELWNSDDLFKDITEDIKEYISNLYKENPPEFIYYLILYHIFNEFLEDISEDEIANEKTGFKESIIWNKLYDFQKDAVLGIINKLERHNGCILADSVGLGKTFSALGVMKYYQERNRSILVLCPKKLGDNWLTYLNNYDDNILNKDRFNYDVLYHTDLSREKGDSNGIDLSRINWGNYDLVVIDESHNFRNNDPRKDRETRYQKLLKYVMRDGVKTKLLMLSATPVNNRFTDLRNQIALAYEGKTSEIDEKMNTERSIDVILKNAQRVFNEWSKLPESKRTAQSLLSELNKNFDFFKLLDSVTIARSRKHIERYYDMEKIGKFPKRLKPISIRSKISTDEDFLEIKEIYQKLSLFNMSAYSPFEYILSDKKSFYEDKYDDEINESVRLRQINREKSLQKLMRVNFLKRLESSAEAFRITLGKFVKNIEKTIDAIDNYDENKNNINQIETTQINNINFDENIDDWIDDDFSIGDKVKINLADMNTSGWKYDLEKDLNIAKELLSEIEKVTPEKDQKLIKLKDQIDEKINNPINSDNRKIIIFTAFADTANYLYRNIANYTKDKHNIESAKILGTNENECTLDIDKQFNNLLINFSPIAKSRKDNTKKEIDILIATDCISEGQNLQDCDYLINYDIHWNPVRIIQRFGRIDRIGSKNEEIQLVNFWPDIPLEEYINLKKRVESRMFMVDATGGGEENPLTEDHTELEYRKKQLEKLKEEVVDIEEMNSGISITDLGLNDFRMDLINYMNEGQNLDDVPTGMHTVCKKSIERDIKEGVIFVMKNRNQDVNIDNTNQLHPFYLVYIGDDGEIISNHLEVKNTLDIIRIISKGKSEPIKDAYEIFNDETDDGKKMEKYSELLNKAIESILNVKDESDIDSLFSEGGTTMLENNIKGLSDFELISFIVIK
jgi:superfamily II DNA or RNA helicase